MLSWYLGHLKEHGFLVATGLLLRVVRSRASVSLSNRLLPARVNCPCCGWEGRRFHDFIEVGVEGRGAECPACNSHPRHRAFALWLKETYHLESKTGSALVFAPERALEGVWATARNLRLARTDIEPTRGVDLLSDIQRLPFADGSFDLIWCQHVLTHVPDDRASLRELARVLTPETGELVLSVAQEPGTVTREFGGPNKDFLGFWRIYGDDFEGRLAEGGLRSRWAGHELPESECLRYGIEPAEGFFICTRPASS
jgi:SAM-dependent methyltransferase